MEIARSIWRMVLPLLVAGSFRVALGNGMKRALLAFTACGIWLALQFSPVFDPLFRWADQFTEWLLR